MNLVKYLCCLAVLFASCRSTRQIVMRPTDVNHLPIAYAVSPKALPNETGTPQQPVVEIEPGTSKQVDDAPEQITAIAANTVTKATTKKATSFAQLKEMAAGGEIKMSRRDIKVLNKLEKKYKGNFEQFRADTFEFTTNAKIVAGIGAVGLLLAIFTGSGFGWFLFILAALGFVLRYLDIIEF